MKPRQKLDPEGPSTMGIKMKLLLLGALIGPSAAATFVSPRSGFGRPAQKVQNQAMAYPVHNTRGTGLFETSNGNDDGAPTKAQSAASFLALRLQMIALEKAMQAGEKGDEAKAQQMLDSLEKMMPVPPSTTASSSSHPAKKELPGKPQFTEVDKAKTLQILDEIDQRYSSKAVEEKPDPSSKDGDREEAKVDEPVGPTAPKAEEPKPEEKVVPKPAAVGKLVEPAAEPVAATVTEPKSTAGVKMPSCVSKDFGQALPVMAENLPPLRVPIVPKTPAPAAIKEEPKVAEEETTPLPEAAATEEVKKDVPVTFTGPNESFQRALLSQRLKYDEGTQGQSQDAETAVAKADSEDEAAQEEEERKAAAEMAAKEEAEAQLAAEMAAKLEEERKLAEEKAAAEKAKAEKAAQEEATKKAADEAAAMKAQQEAAVKRAQQEAAAKMPKQEASPSSDDPAQRYGSMPVGERAATILRDLGMVESSPDPDDPSYDHSKDDEFCPENKWKDSS